jgi:hypothetical protein
MFRVKAQAKVSWNFDFSYIYPIYVTQGTLGNGGKMMFDSATLGYYILTKIIFDKV